jgi:hypothetical protein
MDSTTKQFLSNQNRYQDIVIPCRYSIGAIIFTHNFWQKMGGWKVDDSFRLRYIINNKLSKINLFIAQLRRKDEQKRIAQIIDIITNTNVSALGVEEEYLYQYSMNNGYKQYLTTEGIVYHFAFSPTEDYIMRTSFLKIRY